MNWPEKKTGLLLTSENDYYARGWNACLSQCTKVLNSYCTLGYLDANGDFHKLEFGTRKDGRDG